MGIEIVERGRDGRVSYRYLTNSEAAREAEALFETVEKGFEGGSLTIVWCSISALVGAVFGMWAVG